TVYRTSDSSLISSVMKHARSQMNLLQQDNRWMLYHSSGSSRSPKQICCPIGRLLKLSAKTLLLARAINSPALRGCSILAHLAHSIYCFLQSVATAVESWMHMRT